MRDDYKMKSPTVKIEVEVEKAVAESLNSMEGFTKIKKSEIVNTAMKRFIAGHKDFLPPEPKRTPGR